MQRTRPKIHPLIKAVGHVSIAYLSIVTFVTLLGRWAEIEAVSEGFTYVALTLAVVTTFAALICWSLADSVSQ